MHRWPKVCWTWWGVCFQNALINLQSRSCLHALNQSVIFSAGLVSKRSPESCRTQSMQRRYRCDVQRLHHWYSAWKIHNVLSGTRQTSLICPQTICVDLCIATGPYTISIRNSFITSYQTVSILNVWLLHHLYIPQAFATQHISNTQRATSCENIANKLFWQFEDDKWSWKPDIESCITECTSLCLVL